MTNVLFVSNGHGEVAIAARVAAELVDRGVACDHLALVGAFDHPSAMRDVGPRRAMPSGGLIAMGNLRNIARDVGGGLIGHTLAQLRFVRGARGTYDAAIAVGDVFALGMAMQTGAPAVFVGTAKSVYVAPYGRFEERMLRKAARVFVRDAATAERLRSHGIAAESPGNVIVDLYADGDRATGAAFDPQIALFPGSRASAYGDARFLVSLVRDLARGREGLGGILSIAPGLGVDRFAAQFVEDGWRVVARDDRESPFSLFEDGREVVRVWRGPIGAMIRGSTLVLGQAGTANEAAAAAGIPVVAFELGEKKTAWYRRRQAGLLGDALAVFSGDRAEALESVSALLDDRRRRELMGETGRARMGAAGGAHAIAAAIAELVR